jgi:hypothetical protein
MKIIIPPGGNVKAAPDRPSGIHAFPRDILGKSPLFCSFTGDLLPDGLVEDQEVIDGQENEDESAPGDVPPDDR